MAIQDGFKVTALTLLNGGTGWGTDTTGNLKMRGPGTHIDVGTGFTGTYGTDGSGVIDEVAITAAGKNYSSGSWSYDPIGSAITTTYNYSSYHWNPSSSQLYTNASVEAFTNDTNNRIGVYDDEGYFQVLTYDTSVGGGPPYITGATGWRRHPDGTSPQVTHATSIYNVQASKALPGEFCSIGIAGTGHGAKIIPTIGQTEDISMDDMSVEFGNASETANITIHNLYQTFESVAGDPGSGGVETDVTSKPNFDWYQGGPVSASAPETYQRHPIRFDEFYGATYDTYGGLGCLGIGTPITMADGSTKNIEDVNVGDWVKTVTVTNMPLDFDDEDTWLNWYGVPHEVDVSGVLYYEIQTNNMNTVASASVQDIYFDYYENYYLINETLKATYEHPFFILRDGQYQFKTTVSLLPGDKVFTDELQFEEIESVDFIDEVIETVNFNVEDLDVYFGGGYLMHNVHDK
jgi:hypothetical protein